MKKIFPNLEKKHYWLLAGWLIINLIQATFTNLHNDEAYYWLYSKQMAWGYFDHPPMTAILIYLGDSILHWELGVRLFFFLLSTLTIAMLMNEINEKKDLFFLSLFILSFPLVHTHIGGFMALPDTPLVFFTLLFFLGYKKFVTKPTYQLSILLGVVAAAMIYSKYHAFVALGLIVLSNLKLLKSKYFWVTVVVASILLLPHVFWQINNHFPTFQYHLIGRSKPIRFWTVQNNITSQLLVAGPLTCLIVFFALTKFKTNNDPFKRALLFSILGFYIFFFIMSFKNRIEAHYTTAITPLLIIATYPVISGNSALKKWFKRLALPVVILFFVFRFYLAADFLPNFGEAKIAFYKHKVTTAQIKEMAAGKHVASFDNFAFPGTYQFYTGDPVIHLATPGYRYCQFDLWNEESKVDGETLFAVIPDRMDPTNLVQLKNGKKIKPLIIPEFQSLKQLELKYTDVLPEKDTVFVKITLTNQSDHPIWFKHPSMPLIGFTHPKQREILTIPLYEITGKEKLFPNEKTSFIFSIPRNKTNIDKPVILFTQTNDRNRGQMVSFEIKRFLK